MPSAVQVPRWLRWALIAALSLAVYLPALGSTSAGSHPDEALYLAVSADMAARDTWLTPTLDGAPAWQKPPLLYWGERLSYLALGSSTGAGRLPSALCAVALTLLIGLLATRAVGPEAGELAAAMAAGVVGFAKFGRLAMMDVPLALALTAAALAAWSAAEEGRPARLLASGVAVGLACLLKGPVAAVIAGLGFGAFLALRRPELLRSRWALGAVALCALVALPWFAASLVAHGQAFAQAFFVGENLARFGTPWTLSRELLLMGGFLVFLLPWSLAALGNALRPGPDPARLLALLWIGAVLLVFSIPGHKYPHYGLACTPAAVLLAASAVPPSSARRATGTLLAALGLLSLLAVRWPVEPVGRAALLAVGLALASAGALHAWGRLLGAALLVDAALALVMAVVVPAVNPPLVPEEAGRLWRGREVFAFQAQPGGYQLLLGEPVRRVVTPAALEEALRSGGVVIAEEGALAGLGLAEGHRVLLRWPRFRTDLAPGEVLRSWAAGDLGALYAPMVAVERGAELAGPRG